MRSSVEAVLKSNWQPGPKDAELGVVEEDCQNSGWGDAQGVQEEVNGIFDVRAGEKANSFRLLSQLLWGGGIRQKNNNIVSTFL